MWTFYNSTGQRVADVAPALYTAVRLVSTGTTDAGPTSMAVGNVIAIWSSTTAGSKTQNAPAATGSNNLFTIIETAGIASSTNPIVFTPASGTIPGPASGSNAQMYIAYGNATWADTSAGWVRL